MDMMDRTIIYLIFLCVIHPAWLFNIDMDNPMVFQGKANSHFGTTSEMVFSQGINWLLVGAPRDNFTDIPQIVRPGNVYKCPIQTSGSNPRTNCEAMMIRSLENTDSSNTPGIYEQTEQNLGSSIVIGARTVVVCSPGWKNLLTYSATKLYRPTGICFEVDQKNLNSITQKNFRVSNQRDFETGFIGFSSASSAHPVFSVLLGSPNTVDARGGFTLYLEQQSDFNEKYTVLSGTETTNSMKSGAYMGYALGSGRFGNNPPMKPQIIVGAPGFTTVNGPVGSVSLLDIQVDSSIVLRKRFTGTELGGGYGQSILVADVNGDNLDDVLVGAPMESLKSSAYDRGAVYVYYGTGTPTYLNDVNQKLQTDSESGSRFGTSMVSLGDINLDRFNDIAIGAPYEESMRGVVYIYQGDENQMQSKYSQRIPASSLDTGLRGFGFSLSKKPLDVDNNTYNDLAIGAYMSSQTVILRTRPIVNLQTTFRVQSSLIPLNSTGLECSGGNSSLPCLTLNLCFSFTGRGLSQGMMIDYSIKADVLRLNKKFLSRVNLYLNGENKGEMYSVSKFRISTGQQTCEEIYARVKALDRTFFQAIAELVRFDVVFDLSNVTGEVTPVLNNEISKQMTTSAQFETGCSATCRSNLEIEMSIENSDILLGQTRELIVDIQVMNTGDPSYATSVLIAPSDNTAFIGFIQDLSLDTERVLCSRIENSSAITCDFGTPMLTVRGGIFRLRFDVSRDRLMPNGLQSLKDVQINATVRNTAEGSVDQDPGNNFASKSASIRLQSEIDILGRSDPEQAKFTTTKDKYIIFSQEYTVFNHGPSPSPGVVVEIDLPVRSTVKQEIVMQYNSIMAKPSSNTGTCNVISYPGRQIMITKAPSTTKSPSITVTRQPSSSLRPGVNPNTDPGKTPIPRKKRETSPDEPTAEEQTASEKYQNVACTKTADMDDKYQLEYECARIKCTLLDIDFQSEQTIQLSLNISEASLPSMIQDSTFVRYITEGKVFPLRQDSVEYVQRRNNTAMASVDIFPVNVEQQTEPLNIWIIIGGSIGGLVFIIIIVLILWKCGFFKREKRDKIDEHRRKTLYQMRQSRMSMRGGKGPPPADQEAILPKDT